MLRRRRLRGFPYSTTQSFSSLHFTVLCHPYVTKKQDKLFELCLKYVDLSSSKLFLALNASFVLGWVAILLVCFVFPAKYTPSFPIYLSSVICSVTMVLTIMIAAAAPGIKNITAQFVVSLPFPSFLIDAMMLEYLGSSFCE